MVYRVTPAASLRGSVRLPGDKSISHRYAMISSIAEGESRLANYSTGADCQSTLQCMAALGVPIERQDGVVVVQGRGLKGLREPAGPLDAGNSGSTIRMLSGILAAQPFATTIGGDESLSRRPMQRVIDPLTKMGATVTARDGKYPPLSIRGARLQAISYEPPVASAQIKTCVLFAGVFADGLTTVVEKIGTRDHTEVALREFGAAVETSKGHVMIEGGSKLTGRSLRVPGDLSSAAFFLVAATLFPDSRITLEGVGLSPSRTQLLDWMMAAGAKIRVLDVAQVAGEMIGTLQITGSRLKGGEIAGAFTAGLIDEIPALAVAGAVSSGGLVVRDASELRVKETDRISTIVENLRRLGVTVEERPDGFQIPGNQTFRAATLDSFGDHRIAMAFTIAGLAAGGPCTVENAEAASVSFPEFYDTLESLRA